MLRPSSTPKRLQARSPSLILRTRMCAQSLPPLGGGQRALGDQARVVALAAQLHTGLTPVPAKELRNLNMGKNYTRQSGADIPKRPHRATPRNPLPQEAAHQRHRATDVPDTFRGCGIPSAGSPPSVLTPSRDGSECRKRSRRQALTELLRCSFVCPISPVTVRSSIPEDRAPILGEQLPGCTAYPSTLGDSLQHNVQLGLP